MTIILYGAGEQGRVILDSLRRSNESDKVLFIDDDPGLHGSTVEGREVIGDRSELDTFEPTDTKCIVAFGDAQTTRLKMAETVRSAGLDLHSVIDPEATVSSAASIGDGVYINAASYIGPNSRVSALVLVDSCTSISHDVSLSEGVTIGPGATIAGGVSVGRDAFIGAGATVLDDQSIGAGAFVGAGAVVIDDVDPHTTVAGVPAEPIEGR